MSNLANLIANGEITVEELAAAKELIERAQLVTTGIKACKKTLLFPLGVSEIECYSCIEACGAYHSWGKCTIDGIFTCYSNWGGDHMIGSCNLKNFKEVFMGFENPEFGIELTRFLHIQIEIANKIE